MGKVIKVDFEKTKEATRADAARSAEEARIAALEHFVGSKYEATKSLDIAEIAKIVRKDIKAAIKAGLLPKVKTSVRISRFSGGCSLDVYVKTFPEGFDVANRGRVLFEMDNGPYVHCRIPLLSVEATRVVKTLEAIVNAYNFDKSDTMTDYFHVRFYGHVNVEGGVRGEDVERIKAEIAEERAAWDTLSDTEKEEALWEVRAMYAEVERHICPDEALAVAMRHAALRPRERKPEAVSDPEPAPEPAPNPEPEEPTDYELGRAAFEAGIVAIPLCDPALVERLKVATSCSDVIDEWTRGWHEANAAAPVEPEPKDDWRVW